jgi:hypothetical protein
VSITSCTEKQQPARAEPCGASHGEARRLHTSALHRERWRAITAVLRTKGVPAMVKHADHLEAQLEQHGPDEDAVPRA